MWNACGVIKGSISDKVVDNVDVFSRPKVLLEGHIDSVNPATHKEALRLDGTIPESAYDLIRIAPATENVVSTAAELAAIQETLHFDSDHKIIEDENFAKAYRRFKNLKDAQDNGGYRTYIPGYSDAMSNTITVYHMAKLMKEAGIKPVYDIWFCSTSGEEGRGNIVGMKQLFGYNQDASSTDAPTLAEKGRNTLNFVGGLSIDGGNISIHYLGSYRYEVNYKPAGTGTIHNAIMAAARSIAGIADLRSPSEIDNTKPRTTYTVGIVYMKDNNASISYEIDMRSPVPETLVEMQTAIVPHFVGGMDAENAAAGSTVVAQDAPWLWYGDRPAHQRAPYLMRTDPLIFAAWRAYTLSGKPDLMSTEAREKSLLGSKHDQLKLGQYPVASTSLNDNVPGAMGIPYANMNLAGTAAGGGGHAFNEWGIPGPIQADQANFKQVLYTILAIAGMNDANGNEVVPAAYPVKAPRHVRVGWGQ